MIADEAMADFDEQDDFEEDESATEDEKVTPWSAITDTGNTPEGSAAEVMRKIEDEVMEVAHSYDVRKVRKYCVGDPTSMDETGDFNGTRPVETARVRLINDSQESERIIEESNTVGLQMSNNANAVHGKKGSVAPFDMAQDSMTFSAD